MLDLLTLLLRDLGLMVYGGSLLAFTLLVACTRARVIPYLTLPQAIRAYRAWGPGLGLSMGAIVLHALLHHYLTRGGFSWPLDDPATPAWMVFFVAWVSNLRLEVWTLDPLRKLDSPEEGVTDLPAFEQAADRLLLHMSAQSALIFITVVLFFFDAHT